jgi:gamma-glutamylcyclotransferase (GGCT)/AIG2-like uncharacterized protein YtfP
MKRLFVYGTLKRGKSAHYLLQTATFVGAARARGFVMLDAGTYPVIVPARAGDDDPVVDGELYDVPEDAMDEIDQWEDHPNLLVRTAIKLEDGSTAESYLAQPHHAIGLPRIRKW